MIANHAQKFNCLFVFAHPIRVASVRMGDNAAAAGDGGRKMGGVGVSVG